MMNMTIDTACTKKAGDTFSWGTDFSLCPDLRPQVGERRLKTVVSEQTGEVAQELICVITSVTTTPRRAGAYTHPDVIEARVEQVVRLGRGTEEAERLRRADRTI